MKLEFSYDFAKKFINDHELSEFLPQVETAVKYLEEKKGAGNDYLGWIDLPENYDKEEFARIKKSAEKIKSDSEVFVVIGIGGSYLGSKAAIEFLSHTFANKLSNFATILFCSLSGGRGIFISSNSFFVIAGNVLPFPLFDISISKFLKK